jgi:hypothetical protein
MVIRNGDFDFLPGRHNSVETLDHAKREIIASRFSGIPADAIQLNSNGAARERSL